MSPRSGQCTVRFSAVKKLFTLVIFTQSTFAPVCLYSISTSPAGASIRIFPGIFGVISPSSRAIVIVPIVPCPHMGRAPEVSINKIAKSFLES